MNKPLKLGLIGHATARVHSYLKRHRRLRGAAISAFGAIDSLIGRVDIRERSKLGDSVEPHQWVEEWNSDHGRFPARIKNVLQAENITNPPAMGLHGKIDPPYLQVGSVEIPSPFVLELPGGHVIGEHGAVVTPDGHFVGRVSRPVRALHTHLSGHMNDTLSTVATDQDWNRRPKRVEKVAVLSSFAGRGYFHWMFDVLPRLRLLEESCIPLGSVDQFIVPNYFARFQIETLARFGIGRSRILTNLRHRHVVSDHLIVPSHPRETGVIPAWVCEFIRQTFKPARPPGVESSPRIYLTRKQTDHGLLGNESGLIGRLGDLGFTAIVMEEYSLEEKAWLLKNAEVVVSASGGGLANIVFCEPGTVVVELRVQPYPVMEAWDIGNRMGLQFYDVLPEGYERSEGMSAATAGMSAATDGTVSEDAVMSTLELAGIST